MYIPKHFQHGDPKLIAEFVESYPFATAVTHQNEIFANHFPFLLESEGGKMVFTSHMARNNPQWNHIEQGSPILLIFQGPHAYISPSIYVNKLNVPTWNYTAVHVYGKARAIHDPLLVEKILIKTVEKFEGQKQQPWKYDLPQDFRDRLIKAIVGFEVEVERIESKFKLSQNRASEDYQAVLLEFAKYEDTNSRELLKYMAATKN